MRILEKGRVAALYAGAEGASWVGQDCCFVADREHLPILVNGRRFLLEFVLPRHLMEPGTEPKAFKLGTNKRFLPRRDYREIFIYLLGEGNLMRLTMTDDSLFDLKSDAPLFISTIRAAVCQYVSHNPATKQFLFRADGAYGKLITQTLKTEGDNEAQKQHYRIRPIEQLQGPYFGFELDVLSLTN